MALDIPAKAKELGIKLENLLTGLAREEIISLFSMFSTSENFLLCFPSGLGVDNYKKELNRRLYYVCEAGEDGSSFVGKTMGSREEIQLFMEKDRENHLLCEVTFENMRVPMEIFILHESGFPAPRQAEGEFTLTGVGFSYLQFPRETQMAEDFFTIIKNLELIKDMSPYHRLYTGINSFSVEGKLLWLSLKELCEVVDPKDFERVKAYGENNYMSLSWDKYLKGQNLDKISWKETISLICDFMGPICTSLLEDTPFLGDWMPELRRFL